jgi:signal transduction histidine kinase
MEDITFRRAVEEQRVHAERRAGIVETTVAVAHEMNNALTVLMLNAELLSKETPSEELPGIATEILTAAAAIASTVQRLRNSVDQETVEYIGSQKMLDLSPKPKKASKKK